MSKIFFPTTGTCPITRIRDGFCARINPLISWYCSIVPVYVEAYQFQDSIEAESRFALTGYPKKSVDDIRDDIYKKALDLDIPAKREDIHVSVTNGSVEIGTDYSVLIDLKVYQYTLQFHPHADNHTI